MVSRAEAPGANPQVSTLDRLLRAAGARLELSAPEVRLPDVDEGQILERLRLRPAQRLASFSKSHQTSTTWFAVPDASPPDLDALRILRALVEHGTDFVVIGGIATVLYGSSRKTFDLGISFAVDPQNLEALGEVLLALSARLRGVQKDVSFVPDAATLRRVET